MASNSIFISRRWGMLRAALLVETLVYARPGTAQEVYRFYESGAAQQMVLSTSEIAFRAKPDTSDADFTEAVRRHISPVVTLEKWDQNYLVFIPPVQNIRNITGKSAAIRREPVIVEASPVLYTVQEISRRKSGAPPPGDARLRRLATMRIVTKRVIANLPAPATDAVRIQLATAALSAEPVGTGGWWLFLYETPLDALDAAYWITQTAKLESTPVFERMRFTRRSTPKLTPNDPGYPNQWHLNNALYGINVTSAWDTRQGTGRHILLIDDGVQLTHPDLVANTYSVASGNNYDFNSVDSDPSPGSGNDHGTATAGLVAGRGNNSLGITGVAFMSKVLGVRLTAAPTTDLDEQQAFTWKPLLTDVSSNSWGAPDDGVTITGPGPLGVAGLQSAVTSGRGGRGVVFVFAAGNGRDNNDDDSNYDGYPNSRFVIGVGATTDGGQQAWYSESGANIALVAPSSGGSLGLTTTDRTGPDGYNITDYTSTFSGTSGATPIVAGAAALLIEANPNLGYRDVKEILMRSASQTNLIGGDPFVTNAAGIPFSHSFGAGRLNVGNALALANTWTNLPAETSISSAQSGLNLVIPDNNTNGVTRFFNMSGLTNLRVETVELTVNITHPWRGDLQFEITAPSGMRSTILRRAGDSNDNYTSWTFTSVRHWGESSSGTWSVKIADLAASDVGTLNSLTLRIWGTSGATPPEALSVSPASGNGSTQTFTFTYSDPNGHADLHSARVLIHQQIQAANSCYLYYTKADNKLYLHTDAANALTAPLTPGQAGAISNNQCSVNGAASSVTASGNTLTLNLSISFTAGFTGSKTVFGYAQDVGGLVSGWRTLGTWTVPGSTPAPPQAVSVSPTSGNGSVQVFNFTYSDPNGHGDLHSARVLIHQQLQGVSACYLYYTKADNKLYLHNDVANTLTAPLTPGQAGTIGNSQCSVNGASSSVEASGNMLTLNLSISFTTGFTGTKNVFSYAQDVAGLVSGWQTVGTWTVPGSNPASPQAVSVNPSSGTGSAQAFTFTYSDGNGHADLHSVRVLIHQQLQGANSCYLYYTKADNKLYLHNDAANTLTAPLTPGQAGTIGNSQCSVSGAASSVTASGNTLALHLSITFTASFAGTKSVFGYAQDVGGLVSGWQMLGIWTVSGSTPAPPQAVSVSPTSGSGEVQTFTFTYSDPNGHTDLHSARVLIHQQLQGSNSCYLYYTRADNKLYLHNDAANELTAPLTPGLAGTISNSQCSLNGATSTVAASGNTLTLNLSISFTAGFAGTKSVFGYTQDLGGLVSGWQTLGTWTVTGSVTSAPQAVSVSPASGSGSVQTFTLTYSDLNGHADLHSARVLIHQQIQGSNSCYLYYTKADNKLYLHNDAANALTAPLIPGLAGTVSNSQCSVNGAASSVTASVNTLTLNLSISFTAGFAGAKNVFGYAQDLGGLVSGWQTLGTWTIQ